MYGTERLFFDKPCPPCEQTVVKQDVKVKRGGSINNQTTATGGVEKDEIDPCDTLSRKEKRKLRRNGK